LVRNISDDLAQRLLVHWPQILAELAAGKPVQSFVRKLGFDPSAIYALRLRYPDRDAEWLKAHEESADSFFDRFVALLDDKPRDQVEASDKRTKLDMLRWAAAKRKPSTYSDKVQHEINVKMDMTAIVSAAAARLAAHRAPAISVNPVPHTIGALPALPRTQDDIADAELVPTLADLQ